MDDEVRQPREWDAGQYHGLAQAHAAWAAEIVDRLPLEGGETVLDLGCGTGRLTSQVLERLGPDGRVIGIDGSQQMVDEATRLLGGDPRASFFQQDLLALEVAEPADAAVSSATFHWIHDHDLLFARVRAALTPGAWFVAQCGGFGNIATVAAAVAAVSAREPFAAAFDGWPDPWNYAAPEPTAERLRGAGFDVERVWLNDSPQHPRPLKEYLRTISLSAHVAYLDEALHEPFLEAVVEAMGPDPVHDYVRLNIVARAI
jgi:trans-aconitate 2-methyltransferase